MLTILNRNLDSGPFCIIFAVAAAGGEDRVFSACPFCIPTAKNVAFIAETVLTSGKTILTFGFPAVRTVFPLPPGDRLKGGCRCRDSRCEAAHPLIFHKKYTFPKRFSQASAYCRFPPHPPRSDTRPHPGIRAPKPAIPYGKALFHFDTKKKHRPERLLSA